MEEPESLCLNVVSDDDNYYSVRAPAKVEAPLPSALYLYMLRDDLNR